jgi:hypothetical protein
VHLYVDDILRSIYDNAITSLDVCWVHFPDPAIAALLNALAQNTSITRVKLVGFVNTSGLFQILQFFARNENDRICELNVNYCGLNDQAVESLVNLIRSSRFISHLNIGYHELSREGYARVLEALVYSQTVRWFNAKLPDYEFLERESCEGGLVNMLRRRWALLS